MCVKVEHRYKVFQVPSSSLIGVGATYLVLYTTRGGEGLARSNQQFSRVKMGMVVNLFFFVKGEKQGQEKLQFQNRIRLRFHYGILIYLPIRMSVQKILGKVFLLYSTIFTG